MLIYIYLINFTNLNIVRSQLASSLPTDKALHLIRVTARQQKIDSVTEMAHFLFQKHFNPSEKALNEMMDSLYNSYSHKGLFFRDMPALAIKLVHYYKTDKNPNITSVDKILSAAFLNKEKVFYNSLKEDRAKNLHGILTDVSKLFLTEDTRTETTLAENITAKIKAATLDSEQVAILQESIQKVEELRLSSQINSKLVELAKIKAELAKK